MKQQKFLVDSNVYFRLAQSIHPLLCNPMGPNRITLYIISEFELEYFRGAELQNKFGWVESEDYALNRRKFIPLSKKQKFRRENAIDAMADTSSEMRLTTGLADIKALAHAYAAEITILTDDSDLIKLALEFEVKFLKLAQFLKLLVDEGILQIGRVREIYNYLEEMKDFPKNFESDCKAIFGVGWNS
ncbi:MAG: hypothetical protein M9899_02365 [Bdellovibrionaceae bacterium]|nr:hypothetical protein [Pseudobdellovibrionaceae bacterium]